MKSRAEAVVAGSLLFNGIIILPIYVFGLLNHLDRVTLALSVIVECGALLGIVAMTRGAAAFRALPLRMLVLAALPILGIRRAWQKRSLIVVPAIIATGM